MEDTPVVLVSESQRRRRALLWLAGVTAVTVALAGGSTFALWSASSASLAAGRISGGDLDIQVLGERTFWDVSFDRADGMERIISGEPYWWYRDWWGDNVLRGHQIDTADWRLIPGDEVAMVLPVEITLSGDNMLAYVTVDIGDYEFDTDFLELWLRIYQVTRPDWSEDASDVDQGDLDWWMFMYPDVTYRQLPIRGISSPYGWWLQEVFMEIPLSMVGDLPVMFLTPWGVGTPPTWLETTVGRYDVVRVIYECDPYETENCWQSRNLFRWELGCDDAMMDWYWDPETEDWGIRTGLFVRDGDWGNVQVPTHCIDPFRNQFYFVIHARSLPLAKRGQNCEEDHTGTRCTNDYDYWENVRRGVSGWWNHWQYNEEANEWLPPATIGRDYTNALSLLPDINITVQQIRVNPPINFSLFGE
ncbi:MAG: hypothetical protein FWD83_03915 [Promicromonosporaceae bacterium]|nr:hypothetical protein [Promicromonosporaceae bacterium]